MCAIVQFFGAPFLMAAAPAGQQLAIYRDLQELVCNAPFETVVRPEWIVASAVKDAEPTRAQVTRLFEESLQWDRHMRVEQCLKINHAWPRLWQFFLAREHCENKQLAATARKEERAAAKARAMAVRRELCLEARTDVVKRRQEEARDVEHILANAGGNRGRGGDGSA